MSFFDWMNMNMIVDIAFVVFSGAVIWKLRKNSAAFADLENKTEMHRIAIIQLIEKTEQLDQKLISTIKNPQAARRKLKQEQ